MSNEEYEAAKRLIDIPDIKKGSYSFIGDSNITYADIRILLDYIKDLEQENQNYKEVIDRLKEYIRNNTLGFDGTTGDIMINEKCLFDILKEVE